MAAWPRREAVRAGVTVEGLEGRRLMATSVFLGELEPVLVSNGWGPIEVDASSGGPAAGDGRQISVGGTKYGRGLGVRAGSTIVYDLGGKYDRFDSMVGIDDEVGKQGCVRFRVFLDGKKVYDSKKMVGGQKAKRISLRTVGKDELKLVVVHVSGDKAYDHADWARAILTSKRTPPTPPPVQTPPGGKKPTASNTGPNNASALVAKGSIHVTTNGAVVANVNVSGTITVYASNVTIRNFRVRSSGDYGVFIADGAKNVVIEDGELTGSHIAALYGANFTARRLNIHDVGADGIKALSDCVVDSCYIHDLGMDPGTHADGVQMSGGENVKITNNNIDMPEHTSGGQTYLSNATVFIHSYFGPVDNVLVENNWLNGGNYTIYSIDAGRGHGVPNGVRIVNNTYGPGDKYGLLNVQEPKG